MNQQSSKAALEPSLPHTATELVTYAEGAIVSRTLKKTSGGTLTAFAFDYGQELSEHSAPFDAFVAVMDGEVELTISGKSVLAKSGEIVLMPANIPHAVKAHARCKFLLTMLKDSDGSPGAE